MHSPERAFAGPQYIAMLIDAEASGFGLHGGRICAGEVRTSSSIDQFVFRDSPDDRVYVSNPQNWHAVRDFECLQQFRACPAPDWCRPRLPEKQNTAVDQLSARTEADP
jgi:hypothetical protein